MKEVFLVSLVVGAAAIALWIHVVRWKHEPGLYEFGAHTAAACILLTVFGGLVGALGAVAVALVWLTLVYSFLTAAWGIEMMRGLHR